MREAKEPSVSQAAYFGRCAAAQYPIPLKSMAIQNLYTHHDNSCAGMIAVSGLEEVTFLNSTGGINDDGATAFLDRGWRNSDEHMPTQLKMLRCDKVSRHQCEFLANINSLEKLYLIDPQTRIGYGSATPLPRSPASSTASPSSVDTNNIVSLKDDYLEAITQRHGHTLKHLLLLPQWRLSDDDIALIVRSCPNLEQLAIGVEFDNFKHLRLLVPFLTKLKALRLLSSPDDFTFVNKMREMDQAGLHERKIGEETVNRDWNHLKHMEIGAPDMIFEIGQRKLIIQEGSTPESGSNFGLSNGYKGKETYRRQVKRRMWEDVKDIAIWKMDSSDL